MHRTQEYFMACSFQENQSIFKSLVMHFETIYLMGNIVLLLVSTIILTTSEVTILYVLDKAVEAIFFLMIYFTVFLFDGMPDEIFTSRVRQFYYLIIVFVVSLFYFHQTREQFLHNITFQIWNTEIDLFELYRNAHFTLLIFFCKNLYLSVHTPNKFCIYTSSLLRH